MNEDLLDNISEKQVFTTRTIVISSLFGGIPAGSFMIYQNFKSFGDNKKASASILISIIVLVGTMATAYIPVLENIPDIFYILFTALATSLVTKKYQGQLIKEHIEADGKIHSTGRAVLICVISALLILAIVFGLFLLQDAAMNNS